MASELQAANRLSLMVTPGRDDVVLVHEIDGPVWPGHHGDPWRYSQRGHDGSGWAAGRSYHVSDFVIDLLHFLRKTFERPVRLEGWGIGGLVAVLAATAEPAAVRMVGLHPSEDGWSCQLSRVIASTADLNRRWLNLMRQGIFPPSPTTAQGTDPVLSVGPPTPIPLAWVRAVVAELAVPWWSSGEHILAELLPNRTRTSPPI